VRIDLKNLLLWGILLLAVFFGLQNMMKNGSGGTQQIEYSQFIQQVKSGDIDNVSLEGSPAGYVINVLRGEMSFVGPRPERPYFVEKLNQQVPYYDIRHYVKPGITGWAQVRMDYGASVEEAMEKLEYDLFYVKNHSLFLDFMVLFETIQVVLRKKGAR